MNNQDQEYSVPSKEEIAKAKRTKNIPLEYLPDLEGNERIYEPSRTIGNVYRPHPYASANFHLWQKAMQEACSTVTYGLHELSWHPRKLYCAMCAQLEPYHSPARYVLKRRKTNQLLLLCEGHVKVMHRFKPNELQTRYIRHRPVYDETVEMWVTKPKRGQKQHY